MRYLLVAPLLLLAGCDGSAALNIPALLELPKNPDGSLKVDFQQTMARVP